MDHIISLASDGDLQASSPRGLICINTDQPTLLAKCPVSGEGV